VGLERRESDSSISDKDAREKVNPRRSRRAASSAPDTVIAIEFNAASGPRLISVTDRPLLPARTDDLFASLQSVTCTSEIRTDRNAGSVRFKIVARPAIPSHRKESRRPLRSLGGR